MFSVEILLVVDIITAVYGYIYGVWMQFQCAVLCVIAGLC